MQFKYETLITKRLLEMQFKYETLITRRHVSASRGRNMSCN